MHACSWRRQLLHADRFDWSIFMKLVEPATDLAVALAVAASYFERPMPRDAVAIGEIGAPPPVLAPRNPACMHFFASPSTQHLASRARKAASCMRSRAGMVALPPFDLSVHARPCLNVPHAKCRAKKGRQGTVWQEVDVRCGGWLRLMLLILLWPGLGGELRPVNQVERRVIEAAKLGFSTVIVSAANAPAATGRLAGLNIVGCRDIRAALQAALGVTIGEKGRGTAAEEQEEEEFMA
jgi:hypothetical protein